MSVARLAPAYRREARDASLQMPWLKGLTDEERAWFRVHGRQLAEALIVHLDAPGGDLASESLRHASEEAASYGRMAADLGLSLSQAVEGFLQFRRPFLHQLSLFTRRRGLDGATASELNESAELAMDQLLLAAMTGHGVERLGKRNRARFQDKP